MTMKTYLTFELYSLVTPPSGGQTSRVIHHKVKCGFCGVFPGCRQRFLVWLWPPAQGAGHRGPVLQVGGVWPPRPGEVLCQAKGPEGAADSDYPRHDLSDTDGHGTPLVAQCGH